MGLLDSLLTTAQPGPAVNFEFPLPRDTQSIRFTEQVNVNAADYIPLTIGDEHPDNPVLTPGTQPGPEYFFLVEVKPRRGAGNVNVLTFEHVWANVYADRSDYETYIFEHPEFRGSFPYVGFSVLSTGAPSGGDIVLELGNPHNIEIGDSVILGVEWGYTQASVKYTSKGEIGRSVSAVPSSTEITVLEVPTPDWADYTVILTCVDLGAPVRSAYNRSVNSRVDIDYWQMGHTPNPNNPGFPVATPADIPILPQYVAQNSLGADVPYFSDGTTPTQAAYQVKIDAGTEIIVEASQINALGGEQYERRTRYVVAA